MYIDNGEEILTVITVCRRSVFIGVVKPAKCSDESFYVLHVHICTGVIMYKSKFISQKLGGGRESSKYIQYRRPFPAGNFIVGNCSKRPQVLPKKISQC